MANEKSKAEQYRDERKARIAKAAKQNAKGMEKRNAAKSTASKVVSIILVAAIALGVVGLALNYYGVISRAAVIGGVGEDNVKISSAEYEYYYMSVYNNIVSQISQYSAYGMDYGFDTSLPPDQQTGSYTDADGKEILWKDYIHDSVIEQIKQVKTYYNEAVKAGMKLTDADKAVIDKQIESYKDQAGNMGGEGGRKYSLNAFLRLSYGGSVNEKFLRKMIGQQLLAYDYTQSVVKDFTSGYDQAEIDKAYKAAKSDYDVVNFRVYSISTEKLTAGENEDEKALAKRQETADKKVKKQADDFFKAVTDEKSFIAQANVLNADTEGFDGAKETKFPAATKSSVTSQFSEEIAKWLFDSKTAVGSKKLFTIEGDTTNYVIILLTKGMHQESTVDVRHILFKTVDDQGQALEEDKAAEAKKNAEDALAKFQKGDKTEESFAALATDLSEDTGSQSNGGLYENVLPGNMVAEFDKWIFDAGRKTGDAEIVETEYGYHVIYFVAKHDNYYDGAIRQEKAQEDANTKLGELVSADTNTIRFGVDNKGKGITYAEKKVMKKITTLLQLKANNSANSSAAQGAY